jgi:hypothetical protein
MSRAVEPDCRKIGLSFTTSRFQYKSRCGYLERAKHWLSLLEVCAKVPDAPPVQEDFSDQPDKKEFNFSTQTTY